MIKQVGHRVEIFEPLPLLDMDLLLRVALVNKSRCCKVTVSHLLHGNVHAHRRANVRDQHRRVYEHD